MAVYSYYYGASPEQGIGIRAQSPELNHLPLASEMQELASLHALDSSEHSGEMMAYLLEKEGYSILGISYTESPKASGYNRSAPCSLQYIAPMRDLEKASAQMSRIVNFVSFKKPGTAYPEPMTFWPLNESGYYYHNSGAVRAPLIDGLVRVGLSDKNEILLIGLPKGKSNEYAFARYTMAELLAYLPTGLRSNIRFFTGLPVAEGISDPAAGFDNAVRYGANVVFCPNEYFNRIISYRSCIGVDMEAPGRAAGAFARYISQAPDISDGLAAVSSCLSGTVTYNTLNLAADQAAGGNAPTLDKVQQDLERSRNECRQLKRQIDEGNHAYHQLQEKLDRDVGLLHSENQRLQNEIRRMQSAREQFDRQASAGRYAVPDPEKEGGAFRKIIAVIAALLLLAGGAAGGYFFAKGRDSSKGGTPNSGNGDPAVTETTPEPGTETKEEETEPAAPAPETTPKPAGEEETATPAEGGTETIGQPENATPQPTTEKETVPTDQPRETNTPDPEEELTEEKLRTMYPHLAAEQSDLQRNSRGAVVEELQQRLLELGYDIGAKKPDGQFGPNTEKAVKSFKQKNGIESERRNAGVADKATREKLLSPDAVGNDGDE